MLKTIGAVLSALKKGRATVNYPYEPITPPQNYRGKVQYDSTKCIGCGTCQYVCGGKAIKIDTYNDHFDYILWDAACTRCGMCVEFCPTGALTMSENLHNAILGEEILERIHYKNIPYVRCDICKKYIKPLPDVVYQEILKGNNYAFKENEHICPDCRRKLHAEKLFKGINTLVNR
ncbi:4Fe-4S binding protein [Thermoanaerobacter kivui]|nr:4Fe-4S binding protein [Thermoanaerobacter kivui]